MPLPECATLCSARVFAPMQVYIVLAITITTFAWLLRPPVLLTLPPLDLVPGGVLILVQCLHLWFYTMLYQELNILIHSILVVGYLAVASWLVYRLRLHHVERPPDDEDEAFQQGWFSPEFDEDQ